MEKEDAGFGYLMWGGTEKGKDAGFRKKDMKRGINVRNEQLRRRERNGKK